MIVFVMMAVTAGQTVNRIELADGNAREPIFAGEAKTDGSAVG